MSDIDKAVELARRCLDVGGADYNECDLNTLARAVLAMAPVIEAARTYVLTGKADYSQHRALVDAALDLDAEARRG